jgi:hypothetical protein
MAEEKDTKVTTAETTPSSEGKTDVKESVVIIDGKERPLKNYEAELNRRHSEEKERLKQEYEERLNTISRPAQPSNQPNWYDMVETEAINELTVTGKAFPMKTIMNVAAQIADKTYQTRRQADSVIDDFKDSVSDDPDYKANKKEFNTLVRQLRPDQVSPETLEIVLNSVRGKRLKDVEKIAYEKGKEDALKEREILGGPTNAAGSTSSPKTSLTPEQKADLDRLNFETTMAWTEDEYKKTLLKKQARFKEAGAKNIPQTLNDSIIK